MARRLGRDLAPVLPARLCPLPSPLYTVLLGYKESPVGEARRRFGFIVRTLLVEFLAEHSDVVRSGLGGPVEVVLLVPSSARPGPPPLARIPGLVEGVAAALPRARWARWPFRGARPVGPAAPAARHLCPDATAFELDGRVRTAVEGARALLIDDTYVSGARAQSAAAALGLAGALATTVVPLGRVLRPDRVRLHAEFLRRPDVARDGAGRSGRVTAGPPAVTDRSGGPPRTAPRRKG